MLENEIFIASIIFMLILNNVHHTCYGWNAKPAKYPFREFGKALILDSTLFT